MTIYTNGQTKSPSVAIDAQIKELLKATEILNTAVKTIAEEWTTAGGDGTLIGDTRMVLPSSSGYNAQKTILGAMGKIQELVAIPQMKLIEMSEQFYESRALHIAAEHRIADLLSGHDDEGVPISELAKSTGLDCDKLCRILRVLCSSGIFKETTPQTFANNRISAVLAHNESFRSYILVFSICHYQVAGALPKAMRDTIKGHSSKVNETAFNISHQTTDSFFEWMETKVPSEDGKSLVGRPELPYFSSAMVGVGRVSSTALIYDYPWSSLGKGTVVDVGGGVGGFALELAKQYPDLQFVVQDRAEVIAKGVTLWTKEMPDALSSHRAKLMAEDFFKVNPVKGAEVYFMRGIMHDWPNAESIKILKGIVPAMTAKSRVVIAEFIVNNTLGDPELQRAPWPLPANYGIYPRYTYQRDLVMMSLFNSMERTLDQFREIIRGAGLVIERVWECAASLGPWLNHSSWKHSNRGLTSGTLVMKLTLQDRLLRRETGYQTPYSGIKGIYGDSKWITDLDIVNELGGHSGCVNALSWSRSGRLLASGSDDQHLNIHSYQPDASIAPFTLNTTVGTGHSANIFSVKFMPHSNDQTLVTCAGDGEVRVFDIEYSGRSTLPSAATNRTVVYQSSRRRFNNVYQGVRYLSDGDTNARVYRSHSDRVKRIVTESSPYLFLSCSEDGEVRQWDLRLPSSAYPPPRTRYDNSNVPPPLISYKRFQLDLNTISCSATQPHYIVLGGTHLHCFLHDRRMIGRDLRVERGVPGTVTRASELSEHEDNLMGEATRCVRRFAPNGQKKMRRTDNGHVTACKISDANPNEMIASWSGDHIYSFDLVKSWDARDVKITKEERPDARFSNNKVKQSKSRGRERRHTGSSTSAEGRRRGLPQPRLSSDLALRIRYENGQSEDIPIETPAPNPVLESLEYGRESVLSESQKTSLQIARSVVKIRKLLFSLDISTAAGLEPVLGDLGKYKPTLTSALGFAASCFTLMNEVIRGWRYPVEPTQSDVAFQNTLRRNRDSGRRFIQAAGTLARVLGGSLRTASRGSSPLLHHFQFIRPAENEAQYQDRGQIFSYDFLRAILLWLDGGPQALLDGFKKPADQRNTSTRFPVPIEADISGIDDYLIPYLLSMATTRAIVNVDASRFERDEYRRAFDSEADAVIAFSHAIRMPIEDLSRAIMPASSSADGGVPSVACVSSQDRNVALKYWGFKIGRGVLMNAGEGINFAFLDRAFGGIGYSNGEDEGRTQDDIDPDEQDEPIRTLEVIPTVAGTEDDTVMKEYFDDEQTTEDTHDLALITPPSILDESADHADSESVVLVDDLHNELAEHMGYDDENGSGSSAEDANEDNDDGDIDDDELIATSGRFMWQQASERGKLRQSVQSHVPCVSHTRTYRGHCNVKTVKDVNFFGLQDEYVMSGSDSGHLFIWDKKTSQLVNILEGDGEVVNVMQGNSPSTNCFLARAVIPASVNFSRRSPHSYIPRPTFLHFGLPLTGHPYEPLIAVSGIDHTIKIFSPDRQSQQDARAGLNLGTTANGSIGHSSILRRNAPMRRSQRTPTDASTEIAADAPNGSVTTEDRNASFNSDDYEATNGGLASRKRIHDSYSIVSQNDVERQGGMQDAFITRSVLARLAARLTATRAEGGDGDGAGEGFVTIDENCLVM
ncbi:hypothetical protein MMC26_003053 [Xylographa opegraphella]|nr:hypothetical protein [Xylographa opegraphella]